MPLPNTSNVATPLAFGYEAQISDGVTDVLLRLAVAPGRELTITTAPLSAQQVNTAQVPEEFRAEFGQTYGRSDFSGGAGLDQAHQRNTGPNDYRRFFDSKGVDVFKNANDKGVNYSIELLHSTTLNRTSSNAYQQCISHADVIWAAEGHNIYYSTDIGANWTTSDPYSADADYNITGLAISGDILYVSLHDGTDSIVRQIDTSNIGGGWSNYTNVLSSAVITNIYSIKDYIFATQTDGKLLKLNGTSSTATVKDLPSGSLFVDVTDGGSVILAAADDGYIYSIKDDASSGLVLAGQTFIEGENIVSMVESNGLIFFSTAQTTSGGGKIGRVYNASIDSDGVLYTLVNRQLIKQFGDGDTTVDKSPTSLFATRDQIYFGVIESGSESDLYSIYLPTLGYARDIYYTGTSGLVESICVVKDRLFFNVKAQGLVQENSTYVESGYLLLAAADFYTSQKKQWVGARVYTESIPTGGSVKTEYSTTINDLTDPDASTYSTLQIDELQGDGDEIPIVNVIDRWLIPKVTLFAGSLNASTPKVYSYSYRAFPEPEDVLARIPINVSDRIERPGKRPKNIPGIGTKLYNAVKRLEGKSVILTLFKPDESIRGIVENVTLPIQEITKLGSTTLFCTITVRGQRQSTTTSEVSSLGSLGVGQLGVYQFGV